MASVGLNIHIDKENATPHFRKGDSLKFGPNKGLGSKGLLQATPRKALQDVNKDTKDVTSLKNIQSGEFLKPSTDRIQPPAKLCVRPTNQANTPLLNKDGPSKKSFQEHKSFSKKESTPSLRPTHTKSTKSKKSMPKKPAPVADEEDGYDSDTIWPRAERLSSHIHKVLAWRPPCLVGNEHESDTESSLSDDEIPDQIIIEPPSFFMESQKNSPTSDAKEGNIQEPFLPEYDMASILASLPEPEKPLDM